MERLVLSEVHIGEKGDTVVRGVSHEGVDQEVVSRYQFIDPSYQDEITSSEEDNDPEMEGRESDNQDPIIQRKKRRRGSQLPFLQRSRTHHEVLTLVHSLATPLSLVGRQVWSAAFLLGDFILTHKSRFRGRQAIELGAGPGLPGLIASRVTARCFLTDYHDKVLELLTRNAEANRHLYAEKLDCNTKFGKQLQKHHHDKGSLLGRPRIHDCSCLDNEAWGADGPIALIRRLDWLSSEWDAPQCSNTLVVCPSNTLNAVGNDAMVVNTDEQQARAKEESGCGGTCGPSPVPTNPKSRDSIAALRFDWRPNELEDLLSGTGRAKSSDGGRGLVLLASDVIYDEELTEALFQVLRKLMPPPCPMPSPPAIVLTSCSGCIHHMADNNTTLEGSIDMSTTTTNREVCLLASSRTDDHQNPVPALGEMRNVDSGEEGPVLFLALEKRFNFTLKELSVTATGYKAFLRNVCDITNLSAVSSGGCCAKGNGFGGDHAFEGRRLPLDFEQCFHYSRSDAMELWEIRRRPVRP
ncbi:unnamed protein product [Choristocarpus tenellus]